MDERILLLATGAVAVWSLSGCATSYGPMDATGGYAELQLNERVFEVRFQGNGFTPSNLVQDYLVRRCAELAIESGYSHFLFVDRNTTGETLSAVMNLPTRTSAAGSVIGNTFQASAYTTGGPIPFTVTKHRAQANIFLLTQDEFESLEPSHTALAVDASMVLQQHLGLPVVRTGPHSPTQAAVQAASSLPISKVALPARWTSEASGDEWALRREGESLLLAKVRTRREVSRGEYVSCRFEGTEVPLQGTCREVQFRRCSYRRTRCRLETRARITTLQASRIEGEIRPPHVFDCGSCPISEFPGHGWSLVPAQ